MEKIDITKDIDWPKFDNYWASLEEDKKDLILKNVGNLYRYFDKQVKSIHPKWGNKKNWMYLPKIVDKIVVGTMPPKKYCHKLYEEYYNSNEAFFYESENNEFWQFFNLKDKDKKIKWAEDNHVGFIDLIEECEHKDGKAGDINLKNEVLTDCLKEIPSSVELIFTGYDVPYGAIYYFKKAYKCKLTNIEIIEVFGVKIKKALAKIDNKIFRITMLPSPSRRCAKYSLSEKEKAYRSILLLKEAGGKL